MYKMFEIEIRSTRIKPTERDGSLYYYDIRHDEDWDNPVTIEKKVIVNHWGTLVSTVNLDALFESEDYVNITPEQQSLIYEHVDTGEFVDGNQLLCVSPERSKEYDSFTICGS